MNDVRDSRGDGGRVGEVHARLACVTDPELDEPVTELGFVTGVAVTDAGGVSVGFRLPTYWCAANFAFLMADDMRREVAALPWVTGVSVALDEHMYAETINLAMAEGRGFQEAFGDEADGDLDALRRVFDMKAFQRRQMAVLDWLLESGRGVAEILALDIAGLRRFSNDPAAAALVARYLQRRDIPGPAGEADAAFVDEFGERIGVAGFEAHRRALRRTTVNVEFNGALCRGLLAARYGDEPLPVSAEPGLLDFIRGTVPECRAKA